MKAGKARSECDLGVNCGDGNSGSSTSRQFDLKEAQLLFPEADEHSATYPENTVSKAGPQKGIQDAESISDEEVWLIIRYLDPDVRRNIGDATPFVALVVVILTICVVWYSLHLRGL